MSSVRFDTSLDSLLREADALGRRPGATSTADEEKKTEFKEEDYPETIVPEEHKQSLEIAQTWTLQLLREFVYFWQLPYSLKGGATFEELQAELQKTPNVTISDTTSEFKKRVHNVRLEFAQLLSTFDDKDIIQTFFDTSFEKEQDNWIFLYPVPTVKQFKAISELKVNSQVLQPPPAQKTKRITFQPTPLDVPDNYIHQRVIAESFYISPDLPDQQGLTEKILKFALSRRKNDKFTYDKELKAIEEKVRADPEVEAAATPEEKEMLIEQKIESAWREIWSTPCTRETLWNTLNDTVTFAPYFSSKDKNLYYTHSPEFQEINQDYSIISSGFPVTEVHETMSVTQQITENKFPCFYKTRIENEYDIVWLLLDLRIQELYTCSMAFRFLLQVSTDCQKQFLGKTTYSAVAPIARKKSALKKTVLPNTAEPLRFNKKWVLMNCQAFDVSNIYQTWYSLTLKPILLEKLDSNENNYLYSTVTTTSFDYVSSPEEGNLLLQAVAQFQEFTNSHGNSFDAIFVGGNQICVVGKRKIGGNTDAVLIYYEQQKDREKLTDHFKQYIYMLKPGGLFGVTCLKQSPLYPIVLTVFREFNFNVKPTQEFNGGVVFLWAIKPESSLEGGQLLKWTPEEYFTYMYKLKPLIRDIHKAETQTVNRILSVLKQENVDTSHWEARLNMLFEELLFAITVQQVNEIVTKIREGQQVLIDIGKTELTGGGLLELQEPASTEPDRRKQPTFYQPFVTFDTEREAVSLEKRQRVETPVELLHAFRQVRGGATPNPHVFTEAHRHLRRLQKNHLKLSF